jgi:hypothetical protein
MPLTAAARVPLMRPMMASPVAKQSPPVSDRAGFSCALLVVLLAVGGCRGPAPGASSVPLETETPAPAVSGQPTPSATPNPAKEATAKAVSLYPELGQKDSLLNKKFRALYEEAKAKEPQILTEPNWPLVLALRAADSAPKASP